jgi:hypothetical protein
MAVDILLTGEGDIDLTNNTMTLTKTIEQSSYQQVLITLRTFKGEWFANVGFGIPYLKNNNNNIQILGEETQRFADTMLKAGVRSNENIRDIENYESVFDKARGSLNVSFTAITNTGDRLVFNNVSI